MLPLIKLFDAVSSSSESPSLKAGLSEDQVSPGFLGFLLTFFVVALTAFLIVDMVRRIRRVRYRAQVAGELEETSFPGTEANATPTAGSGAVGTGAVKTGVGEPKSSETSDRGPRRH